MGDRHIRYELHACISLSKFSIICNIKSTIQCIAFSLTPRDKTASVDKS